MLPAGGMAERTRAMLKVEDGCVNFCTYCIIPLRPRAGALPAQGGRPWPRPAVCGEEGYRELVITGIEISGWGHDLKNGETLIDLLEAVSDTAGDMRLRLGSLEPRTITEDFCRRAAAAQPVPHFHLSMQSGCDDTLRRMNRKYDTARFYESVSLLRRYFHRPAVTTDLITGFPGETEEEFAQTLAFIENAASPPCTSFPTPSGPAPRPPPCRTSAPPP